MKRLCCSSKSSKKRSPPCIIVGEYAIWVPFFPFFFFGFFFRVIGDLPLLFHTNIWKVVLWLGVQIPRMRNIITYCFHVMLIYLYIEKTPLFSCCLHETTSSSWSTILNALKEFIPFLWLFSILSPANKRTSRLGTGQYLWHYGTGKFATGPPVIFVPQLDRAIGYFDSWLYRATTYFSKDFNGAKDYFAVLRYGVMDHV